MSVGHVEGNIDFLTSLDNLIAKLNQKARSFNEQNAGKSGAKNLYHLIVNVLKHTLKSEKMAASVVKMNKDDILKLGSYANMAKASKTILTREYINSMMLAALNGSSKRSSKEVPRNDFYLFLRGFKSVTRDEKLMDSVDAVKESMDVALNDLGRHIRSLEKISFEVPVKLERKSSDPIYSGESISESDDKSSESSEEKFNKELSVVGNENHNSNSNQESQQEDDLKSVHSDDEESHDSDKENDPYAVAKKKLTDLKKKYESEIDRIQTLTKSEIQQEKRHAWDV